MFGIPKEKLKILKALDDPKKIQLFLNSMPMNLEKSGDTCFSPMTVLDKKVCHCIEGATLAALALRINGQPPLLLDLMASKTDFDHVVAVFKKYGKWGAISKTNHVFLRYREPVYSSIRELAMSYFHEYFDTTGRKSLRSFSAPINLKRFDHLDWMTTEEEIFYIPEYLADVKHSPILNRKQIMYLQKADRMESRIGKMLEWEE
ncbi:MAG: hypothetical protein US30_C0003G0071 [Candidatus Moranbacteria bacterium GW2011_GWF2_36_839]|nr:MAG: hypothetical protein US27_C0004G0071 [Candidatus Moranbacteria bacterium GW2011_GWF1_36_78]KKQ17504.1 MAG: hypothetical protein US30_C0003G0071 [Candidatus Moranbacteria bacterium GW2011_GWF2_36_839]HAT73967.1 hypothetical protein [Candidatus Moranbacteria bacterium]HBY10507.1 hypothetical protein [Candidatus Moranbacteria bacterium]